MSLNNPDRSCPGGGEPVPDEWTGRRGDCPHCQRDVGSVRGQTVAEHYAATSQRKTNSVDRKAAIKLKWALEHGLASRHLSQQEVDLAHLLAERLLELHNRYHEDAPATV